MPSLLFCGVFETQKPRNLKCLWVSGLVYGKSRCLVACALGGLRNHFGRQHAGTDAVQRLGSQRAPQMGP